MAERVALALISPVGPIAEQSKIRMSKLHRFIFAKIGRSRQSGAAFFWSLRHVVRYAPDLAYRGLMQRVAPADRSVLLRGEVKANLQTALREGLRPGIAGARQDLRLFCAPWGLKLGEIDVPSVIWQGSDDTIVPLRLSSGRDTAQLPARCGAGWRPLLGVWRVPPRARRGRGRASRLAAETAASSTCDSRRNLQQRAP
jgi:pimeloyl-ACP methyl ester carboxylesterase